MCSLQRELALLSEIPPSARVDPAVATNSDPRAISDIQEVR
jgi:hypothetical protein